jgi:hypothetical protein
MDGGEGAFGVRLGSRERERLLDLECPRGLRSFGSRNMVEVVARETVSSQKCGDQTKQMCRSIWYFGGRRRTVVRVTPGNDLRVYNRNDGVTSSRLCRKQQQQHLRARVVGGGGRSERG